MVKLCLALQPRPWDGSEMVFRSLAEQLAERLGYGEMSADLVEFHRDFMGISWDFMVISWDGFSLNKMVIWWDLARLVQFSSLDG